MIPNNGDTVRIQGYEFSVTNVRIITMADGQEVVRFVGVCTDAKDNDPIRNTSYNGGTYGWRIA